MVPNIKRIKLKRIAFQERVCGAIALAGFLVDAFGIRYDVVGNEGIFASARRHKYVAIACDSSGGGSLRNSGGD